LVDKKLSFSINLKEIANCSVPGKNELAFELIQPETADDDVLSEIRVHIPDIDACESLSKEISEKTEYAGQESIVSLYDLPMIVPRGKYSIDMFNSFMRMHGKTHNYKILYKHITKLFLLPKPDGIHINLVIGLEVAIKQGNTLYPFVVMQFTKDSEESILVNLPDEEIPKLFEGELSKTIEGKTFDVMSKLLKAFTKTPVIIPGNFKSKQDSSAVKCSVRASEGFLYPLQKSFIFIPKPVIYLKFEEIRFVEFARITEDSITTNRSFDISIASKNGNFQFTGIDREEYGFLVEFLNKKKIPVRNNEEEAKDKESDEHMELDDDEDDDSFNASDLDN
jgi:structure-specific recognition protein 1